MLADLLYAVRLLAKSPAFTFVAVLTLALGIGANSAIFSVVDAVLLRPLPFNDAGKLVRVWNKTPAHGDQPVPLSYPDAVDLRERNKSVDLAVFTRAESVLEGTDQSQLLQGLAATSDIFSVLDLAPFLGRSFGRDYDQATGPRGVLISYALWQQSFGSDRDIVGRSIRLASREVIVLGVLPPEWKFPVQDGRTDYLMPLEPLIANEVTRRGAHFLSVVGHLRPGSTLGAASAELNAITAALAHEYPDTNTKRSVFMTTLHEDMVGDVRPALLVLLGSVGMVLLIACANVANLLLARASARTREMAIRAALGASRLRIIRQLLTESLLLAVFGAASGLLLAWWGLDSLIALGPGDLPRAHDVHINGSVASFTFAVAVLSTVGFGLLPALQLSRRDVSAALQQGGKGSTTGPASGRLRALLIVSQVALSLLLLATAGLLLRSFVNLRSTRPGFDPSRVVMAEFIINAASYPELAQQRQFYENLLARLETTPGLRGIGAIDPLPFGGSTRGSSFTISGRAPIAPGDHPIAGYAVVFGNYWSTMRIPVLRGRQFNDHDSRDSEQVAMVNEAFARTYLAGGDPVGQTLVIDRGGGTTTPRKVVGVVGDSRHSSLGAAATPQVYVPFRQDPQRLLDVVIRTDAPDLRRLSAALREAVQQIDPGVFVPRLVPMESLLSASLAQPRFNMTLLGIFASVATVLASIGIYGVIAYSVTQRTQEIGIRLAMGAQPVAMLGLVLRQSLALVALGLIVGMVAALSATRFLGSMLYGIGANDVATYVSVVVLLGGAGLLASYIPARRAMKVDPMVALRHD